ncbi:hypothetical protein DL96DRAFT_1712111 [Flagelloscypha sp. PMI_526]|nr:hypothetical protein DL96DRAFT_1712111 [Flagelloscypha sp. PMI_526]
MSPLPSELWLQILALLPSSDLFRLRQLSSVFWQSSLRATYGTLNLSDLGALNNRPARLHCLQRKIQAYSVAFVAQQVSHVTLTPHAEYAGKWQAPFVQGHPKLSRFIPSTLLSTASWALGFVQTQPPIQDTVLTVSENLVKLFRQLRGVKTLAIVELTPWISLENEGKDPTIMECVYVRVALQAFSSTLVELDLSIESLNTFPEPPPDSHLPALQAFRVHFGTFALDNPALISRFVQESRNLRHISIFQGVTTHSLSSIFPWTETKFPSLISINYQLHVTDGQPISYLSPFMNLHAQSLRSLSVTPLFHADVCALPLDNLTHFECEINNLEGAAALRSRLSEETCSLRDLVIRERERYHFVLPFPEPSSQSVSTLSLSLRILDLEIFLGLARTFPRLRILEIVIDYGLRWPGVFVGRWPTFSTPNTWDSKIRDYANQIINLNSLELDVWKLEDIDIKLSDNSEVPLPDRRTTLWVIMLAMKRKVPTITSFCGQGHCEVPEGEDSWNPSLKAFSWVTYAQLDSPATLDFYFSN